ncbi:hypothetical protein FB107DRAFT_280504 [Schizophyllum commune]
MGCTDVGDQLSDADDEPSTDIDRRRPAQPDAETIAKVEEHSTYTPDALDTSTSDAKDGAIHNEHDHAGDAPVAEPQEQAPDASKQLVERAGGLTLELPAHEAQAGDAVDEQVKDAPNNNVADADAPAVDTERLFAAQANDKGSSEIAPPANSESPVQDNPAVDAAVLDMPIPDARGERSDETPAEGAADQQVADGKAASTRETSVPEVQVAIEAPVGQDDNVATAKDPTCEAPAENALNEPAPRAHYELASTVVDGQATRALLEQAGEAPAAETNDQAAPQVNDERATNNPGTVILIYLDAYIHAIQYLRLPKSLLPIFRLLTHSTHKSTMWSTTEPPMHRLWTLPVPSEEGCSYNMRRSTGASPLSPATTTTAPPTSRPTSGSRVGIPPPADPRFPTPTDAAAAAPAALAAAAPAALAAAPAALAAAAPATLAAALSHASERGLASTSSARYRCCRQRRPR